MVNGRGDRAIVEETAAEIRAAGGRAMPYLADVAKPEQVAGMVDAAVKEFGGVDIAVNNAGLRRQTPFLQMNLEEWHEILSVALDGAFVLAKATVPEMIKRGGGALIGLSGVSHHAGSTGRVHVNASKAGLEGFIRGLAMELAPHNITANCVAPGSIDTVRGPSAGGPQGRGSLLAYDPTGAPGPAGRDRGDGAVFWQDRKAATSPARRSTSTRGLLLRKMTAADGVTTVPADGYRRHGDQQGRSAMTEFTYDHVHLRSPDPDATAAYYRAHVRRQGHQIGDVERHRAHRHDARRRHDLYRPGPDGADLAEKSEGSFVGLDHLGLRVRNIDAVCDELKAKGAEFTIEPKTIRPGVRIAFVRGPQNVLIELLDRDVA